jgi:hypothetical protein
MDNYLFGLVRLWRANPVSRGPSAGNGRNRLTLPQGQTDPIIKINLSGPVGFHLHGRYRVEPVF